jgi:hypothetical protein
VCMEGVGDSWTSIRRMAWFTFQDLRCTVCKMHRFTATTTCNNYFRIHLEHMQRTGRPIKPHLQGKAIYFFCLCIVLLPYIQANTRCKTKGLKKYKITVHRQRDHEDCLMNIQVPGSWSLDCPSPLLQNIWPLLVNCINVSMSQETLYWNCLPS